MRKILVGLAALTTLAFASCTKEKSFEDESATGPSGGMTDGNLLTKIVIQMGSDSASTSFGYDAGNRLVTEANKGNLSIVSDDSVQQVTRDAQGIIQKIVVFPDRFSNDHVDYTLRYDATSKRYTAKLTFDDVGHVEDSIAYYYDASGKITAQEAFVNFGGVEAVGKQTIEYDASGNVRKVTTGEYEAGTLKNTAEMTMEYDSKVNPIKLGVDAIIMDRQQYFGNNNVTRISIQDLDDPTLSREITLTYTYNASNKPLTAAISMSGAGGATIPVRFRYQ
jgi:hypothetical protein